MGFCSKYSETNSTAYRSVRRYRVGRKSFSTIANEKSRMSIRCRMIPLCKGVVSRNNLTAMLNSGVPSRFFPKPSPSKNSPFPLPRLPQTLNRRVNTPICTLYNRVPRSLDILPGGLLPHSPRVGVAASSGPNGALHRASRAISIAFGDLVVPDVIVRAVVCDIVVIGIRHFAFVERPRFYLAGGQDDAGCHFDARLKETVESM